MVFTKVFLVAAFAAVAFAAAIDEPIPILSQESDADPSGKFHWSFESGDGTKAVQDGELKVVDKDNSAETVHGQFSFQADDGKTYSVAYVADENGYQPQGDHLPVAPEIPAPIARALAYLATAPPPKDEKH